MIYLWIDDLIIFASMIVTILLPAVPGALLYYLSHPVSFNEIIIWYVVSVISYIVSLIMVSAVADTRRKVMGK